MKIKYNETKDTYTVKGLTPTELAVINTLLMHVRLGDGEASDVAFDFTNAFDELEFNTFNTLPDINVFASPSEEVEGVTVELDAPILSIYAH